ncbi:chaplin [Kitasatospora sp. NPDC047058]|uniref:chaplin n=1 Tax=Kitasatospora sp. NPDC047058 TaxID=3155620 RepID=UPI0033CB7C80
MRNVAKKGLLTAVATGSVLASTAGYAYAGAEAQGGAVGSPGVASGNSVQVPVEVPINACGNTADVVGMLNPAFGNHCANASGHRGGSGSGSGQSASGASAAGSTAGSPGVVSGNSVQVPVHAPVNACGNSVNVVGVGNPAFGNACGNETHTAPTPPSKPDDDCPDEHGPHNPPPGQPSTPPSTPPSHTPSSGETTPGNPRTVTPAPTPAATPATAQAVPVHNASPQATPPATDSQLASTGAGGTELLGAAGLALLLGGGVLYRRARAGVR